MSKELLIIFTRNPELGKVKTRLAAKIGDEAALEVYKTLLQHTKDICSNLNLTKHIYYSEAIPDSKFWPSEQYDEYLQQGDDLGQRMYNAFKAGFSMGFERICLIGSDLFDLKPSHLIEAFNALGTNNYVIGPAQDGGYYLIGMTQLNKRPFEGKSWGTSSVLKDTLADLKNQSVFTLQELNDIDTFEDLKTYPELLEAVKTL